ncbi:site-specific DNA-methyltransferase [Treponema denticola]|uniref:site-specific DNA-methyltransferase (adenine-specific) n=1 Tax=Treponema denticola TaxID=158 RepID=A0A9Q9EWV1_TREDN|nr:site-specific DNA-methyltransferase [Treponema denticola]UTC90600.1 site-specific DNA-methyltransferase [Treponema denticola]UTD00049.1 site-specific DNA-methyltransferase [Treponema denticola]
MNKEEFIQEGFTVVATDNNENKLLRFLKENYPSIIKDNEIDINELKTIAGLPIDEKVNGYGLSFVGRNFARGKYAQKTTKELKLNTQLSKNIDTTQNLLLKGDNLDSLKILKNHYTGKIKCIYIDPPYNTDNPKDVFVYPDKFDKEEAEVLGLANLSDADFARLEFSFKSKKSHNGWLSFMYPRLLLARDLLSDDGVIFISIDDNEQANLKLLCDDVFGEENFIAQLAVENNPKGRKNNIFIAESYEYCIMYAKNVNAIYAGLAQPGKKYFLGINKPQLNTGSQQCDKYGAFQQSKRQVSGRNKSNPLCKDSKNERCFTIYHFEDNEKEDMILLNEYDCVNDRWILSKEGKELESKGYVRYECINNQTNKPSIPLYTKDTLEEMFKNHTLYFKTDGTIYEKERGDSQQLTSFLANKRFGLDLMTESATAKMEDLFGIKNVFQNSKAVDYIKALISQIPAANCTVLDFFAGSGTTGHAVMKLNAEDGGERKFILCQIDEPIKKDKPASRPAYEFCKDNNLPTVISSITIERLKRAGEKIVKEFKAEASKPGLFEENKKQAPDIGFKVFDSVEAPKLELDESGQISILFNDNDTLSRIYNMIFTVGLDEPTQVPEEVVKDCIYKIGNHYYITNSEKISKDVFADAIKKGSTGGKVFIDGWTASLNGTLQNYKEDVKIVF